MIVLSKGILTWAWTVDGRPKKYLNLRRFFKSLSLLVLAILCIYGVRVWLQKADQNSWETIDRVYEAKVMTGGQHD